MKLSAPIYRLKRRARLMSRETGIPLHEALDHAATDEGFQSWSRLAASIAGGAPSREILSRLGPGDLMLLGARPGQGKTLMGLELIVETMNAGNDGAFFTLEYDERDTVEAFQAIDANPAAFDERFTYDDSDSICAGYIIERLRDARRGTLVVIDYLQLLDQKREHPDLCDQVRSLRRFARERGLILVFLSQIKRGYAESDSPCPGLEDVRLPNPLDLALFDKACFLNDGKMKYHGVS